MTPEDQNPRQIHDVNRPGRHSPSPTSRPVIVGHRPTMPDPMVNQRPMHRPDAAAPAEPTNIPISHHHVPIDVISKPADKQPMPTHDAQPSEPELISGEPLQSPPFANLPHRTPTYSTHHQDYSSNTENDPLFHGHHSAGEHFHEQESETSHRRIKWWTPLLVILFLLILGYLLIDSGAIHSSINLPFHFFHQETPPVYTPPPAYIPAGQG